MSHDAAAAPRIDAIVEASVSPESSLMVLQRSDSLPPLPGRAPPAPIGVPPMPVLGVPPVPTSGAPPVPALGVPPVSLEAGSDPLEFGDELEHPNTSPSETAMIE